MSHAQLSVSKSKRSVDPAWERSAVISPHSRHVSQSLNASTAAPGARSAAPGARVASQRKRAAVQIGLGQWPLRRWNSGP